MEKRSRFLVCATLFACAASFSSVAFSEASGGGASQSGAILGSGTGAGATSASNPCTRIQSARQSAADAYYQTARKGLDATFGKSATDLSSFDDISNCFSSLNGLKLSFVNGANTDSFLNMLKSAACQKLRETTGQVFSKINNSVSQFNSYLSNVMTLSGVQSTVTPLNLNGVLNTGTINLISPAR